MSVAVASASDSGIESSTRRRFTGKATSCSIDRLKALACVGSGRLGGAEGVGRGREARRGAGPSPALGEGARRAGSAGILRTSLSRSSGGGGRRPGGRSGAKGFDQRMVGSRCERSAPGSTGRGASGDAEGVGVGLGRLGPRGRPERGGNGCASRLSRDVSAQIAKNVNGTMNWKIFSKRMAVVARPLRNRMADLGRGEPRGPGRRSHQPFDDSRRKVPVPAIADLISVSAWMLRR